MFNYILLVALAFFPSIFWLLVVKFIDRKNPEPTKEIIRVFFWGCLIVIPAFILVQGAKFFLDKIGLPDFLYIIIISFVIDGFIEEYAKYTVLRGKVYHRSVFDEPLDGLVYGVTVAMGFAFVENLLYIIFSRPEVMIMRFTNPTLMHALATGIVGYHLALAKFKNVSVAKKRLYIFLGLVLAVLLHGLYNSVIRYNVFFSIIPLTILIIASYIYLLNGLRRSEKKRLNQIDSKVL